MTKYNQTLLDWAVKNIHTWPSGYIRIHTSRKGYASYTANDNWIYEDDRWSRRRERVETDNSPNLRVDSLPYLFPPGVVVTREEWELGRMYSKIKDAYECLKSLKNVEECPILRSGETLEYYKGKVKAYKNATDIIHGHLKDLGRDLEND